MSDSKNLNYSLLSQKEIDTLIGFLMETKSDMESSVLSQESIDKLIRLIRYDTRHRNQEVFSAMMALEGKLLNKITIRKSSDEVCELLYEKASPDSFIKLSVVNRSTGESMEITPEIVEEEKDPDWGLCIAPITFCQLAQALGVKYTAQTFEIVCGHFAERMYGASEYKIPSIYMPASEDMISGIL